AAAGALPLALERPRMAGERAHLADGERARAAAREAAEALRAHARAHEPHHGMADGRQRAADLALAPLAHHQREARRVGARVEARRPHAGRRRRAVVELDALREPAQRGVAHAAARGDLVLALAA